MLDNVLQQRIAASKYREAAVDDIHEARIVKEQLGQCLRIKQEKQNQRCDCVSRKLNTWLRRCECRTFFRISLPVLKLLKPTMISESIFLTTSFHSLSNCKRSAPAPSASGAADPSGTATDALVELGPDSDRSSQALTKPMSLGKYLRSSSCKYARCNTHCQPKNIFQASAHATNLNIEPDVGLREFLVLRHAAIADAPLRNENCPNLIVVVDKETMFVCVAGKCLCHIREQPQHGLMQRRDQLLHALLHDINCGNLVSVGVVLCGSILETILSGEAFNDFEYRGQQFSVPSRNKVLLCRCQYHLPMCPHLMSTTTPKL